MLVRKQIVVPEDVDLRIRRLAAQRRTSQSAIIIDAVLSMPEEGGQLDRMMPFAGTIEGLPPTLSEEVDATLYG